MLVVQLLTKIITTQILAAFGARSPPFSKLPPQRHADQIWIAFICRIKWRFHAANEARESLVLCGQASLPSQLVLFDTLDASNRLSGAVFFTVACGRAWINAPRDWRLNGDASPLRFNNCKRERFWCSRTASTWAQRQPKTFLGHWQYINMIKGIP